jgi:hypothetical protein
MKKLIVRFSSVCFIFTIGVSACKKAAEATSSASQDPFEVILGNGKTDNWEGDTTYWRVEGDTLIGEVTPEHPLTANTFFILKNELEDFELKAEFRVSENGNSGINYRSSKIADIPNALRGYQFDIDGQHQYTGQNYEERGRTTLAYPAEVVIVDPMDDKELGPYIVNNAWTKRRERAGPSKAELSSYYFVGNDWNEAHLVVKGNILKHYINNALASEVTDNDTIHRSDKGLLGFQLHVGAPMKVEFRNVRLKKLPRPNSQ